MEGQPIRPRRREEEVPQLDMATATNTRRTTTANAFFFIAQFFEFAVTDEVIAQRLRIGVPRGHIEQFKRMGWIVKCSFGGTGVQ